MFELMDGFVSPLPGWIRYWGAEAGEPRAGSWSIEIPLAPFSADDPGEPSTFRVGVAGPEIVATQIRLDFISLPFARLPPLSGRTYVFPVNPYDGYIDGSVYLGAAHNPVDVTRIGFGSIRSGVIQAELNTLFDFTQERVEILNRTAVLAVELRDTSAEPEW